jgi:hypothetical protein
MELSLLMTTWNFASVVLGASTALGIGILSTSPAQALTTFNLTSIAYGVSEDTLTVDGIDLKVSNVISNTNLTAADGDGLCFAGGPVNFCEGATSLQILFNQPVRLLSYLTGFYSFSGGGTTSFTQGSSSSLQTSFPGSEETFTNQFVAAAGIPVIVNSVFSGPGNFQIQRLTVEQITTSVPGPLPMMGAAVALGYSRKLRRRMSLSR